MINFLSPEEQTPSSDEPIITSHFPITWTVKPNWVYGDVFNSREIFVSMSNSFGPVGTTSDHLLAHHYYRAQEIGKDGILVPINHVIISIPALEVCFSLFHTEEGKKTIEFRDMDAINKACEHFSRSLSEAWTIAEATDDGAGHYLSFSQWVDKQGRPMAKALLLQEGVNPAKDLYYVVFTDTSGDLRCGCVYYGQVVNIAPDAYGTPLTSAEQGMQLCHAHSRITALFHPELKHLFTNPD